MPCFAKAACREGVRGVRVHAAPVHSWVHAMRARANARAETVAEHKRQVEAPRSALELIAITRVRTRVWVAWRVSRSALSLEHVPITWQPLLLPTPERPHRFHHILLVRPPRTHRKQWIEHAGRRVLPAVAALAWAILMFVLLLQGRTCRRQPRHGPGSSDTRSMPRRRPCAPKSSRPAAARLWCVIC